MRILITISFVVFVTVFSVQNSGTVSFNFFNFRYELSLALIVIISFLSGLLIGLIYMLPSVIRRNVEISKLIEKNRENNGSVR